MTRPDDTERAAAKAADVFAADRGVGADLAAVDWAATPLGPTHRWPQSLRTAVSILLSSRFPMWMGWGPELTFLCNAAYRRDTLGHKYPWALGRPAAVVWAEVWEDVRARADGVLSGGRATWDEGLLLLLERSGYPEETYHTFSYSPLHDDAGAVVGMLCVVREDTQRIISERRMTTLRELGSDRSVAHTEREVLDNAARELSRNPRDLPFTLTYLLGDDGPARLAAVTGFTGAHPAAAETLDPGDPHGVWPAAAALRGESSLVPLRGTPFTALPTGGWNLPPTHALVVPLLRPDGPPLGFLVAGLNRHRPLDESYRGFVDLAAGHLASGVGSARSYRAQSLRSEELAELDRVKTAFFSNISHEFRTPLTLIMGPLEELRTELADDEPRRRELDTIHRNGLRLSKLVNSLLDFSRIEAGRMRARYEPVDLAEFTGGLASVFRSAVERAGLTFHVDCPPLTRPVRLDRDLWEKVVLNLLSNALKFTFEGSIGVRVREEDDRAVVTVADTGVGVPAAELPRLFERFHRIENTRARSHEGSGIGLALVQELVTLHGGTIDATSTEGAGTRFTVRLPFAGAGPASDALPPRDATAAPTGPGSASRAGAARTGPHLQEALRWLPVAPSEDGNRAEGPVETGAPARPPGAVASARVLVVDDNADMRAYLAGLLRGAGYEVRVLEDGAQALEAVRAEAPDLIVSDVMMPRLDGLQLVGALRADPRTALLPVLLLSARAGQEAAVEGLRAGADDYLVKPFAAAELLARVDAHVRLASLRTHQARWRSAIVDSLQEAFFVCDEDGAVVEINAAFTEMLGYGPEGLPYPPARPWWPDAATDPDAHRQASEAFARLRSSPRGTHTLPVRHRDGRRLWVTASYAQAQDPDSGRRVTVGTFRDVTAEHYAVQRESALASLNTTLARTTSLPEALTGALHQLKDLWRARRVLAAVFGPDDEPSVTATDATDWPLLPPEQRDAVTEMRGRALLTPVRHAAGAGIAIEHPQGRAVLWIDLGEPRPFTDEDQVLLALVAGHLAQGLSRAHQIDQQRETALALQRAILGPAAFPDGFAVRYEPATRPLEVGGDWYDIIPLPDRRIAIVVGDCVGHGLEAATVMGQLRSACRALLLQDVSPGQALMALDHFAVTVPRALCTTMFCGILDPDSGVLAYSSAGHPPGILALPDGTTRRLEGGRSLPLAVRPGRERPEAECVLPPRSTLLLYTDGLVERRGRSLDTGIDSAAGAVRAGGHLDLDALADELMAHQAPADGYEDDVALLVYRHPGPLRVEFPAEATQLAPVRNALRGWLEQCGLPVDVVQSVLVAVGEACANAVEHGHRDDPGGTVRLCGEARADTLRLTVTDSGRWIDRTPGSNGNRGRGITLMRALMDHVSITPGPAGTVVDLCTRIS